METLKASHSRTKENQLEYTDAPSTAPAAGPAQPAPYPGYTDSAEGQASDAVAVMLSVIPGLGHVYKGYRLLGLVFVVGALVAVLLGALAATATAGFGLALIPIYWFAVMFHVYGIEDRAVSDKPDEGEQY